MTHDQIEAMTLSTRIAVMNKGVVQQLGTPKDIYDSPANVFVAAFKGSPSMNLIPARVAVRDGAAHAEVANSDGQTCPLRFSHAAMLDWVGRDIILGIRPETITDAEGADRKSGNIQPFANRNSVTEPAGSDTFVTLTMGDKDVIARMRADATVVPGQSFDFAINREKAVVFDPMSENRVGDAGHDPMA